MILRTDMWHYTKEIRIAIFSLAICLFLLSVTSSSYSQKPLPEISDEDLELLEEFFEQAEALFEEENYEEAISFYDIVLEIDSTDIDALFGKASSLVNIGKYEEAILFYDEILEID